MTDDFSVKSLILGFLEAIGEGELQDSLVIGFLQHFINANNDFCRICEKKFKMVDVEHTPGEEVDFS